MAKNEKDVLNSGRRSKMEIMAAIVAVTQNPSNITRIMGQTNLSYSALIKYMNFMIKMRLIAKNDNTGDEATVKIYGATEKGINFLKKYCEILRLLYGEEFLKNHTNLAVACIQFYDEPYLRS
jgi:predicted transcriptional regulator